MSIFADEFTDMMPATITVQTLLARLADGTPIYSSPHSYAARINNKVQNIIGKDGQQVVVSGVAWLDTVDRITVNDRVIFPGGAEPIIQAVNLNEDENGPCYTALYFQ